MNADKAPPEDRQPPPRRRARSRLGVAQKKRLRAARLFLDRLFGDDPLWVDRLTSPDPT